MLSSGLLSMLWAPRKMQWRSVTCVFFCTLLSVSALIFGRRAQNRKWWLHTMCEWHWEFALERRQSWTKLSTTQLNFSNGQISCGEFAHLWSVVDEAKKRKDACVRWAGVKSDPVLCRWAIRTNTTWASAFHENEKQPKYRWYVYRSTVLCAVAFQRSAALFECWDGFKERRDLAQDMSYMRLDPAVVITRVTGQLEHYLVAGVQGSYRWQRK